MPPIVQYFGNIDRDPIPIALRAGSHLFFSRVTGEDLETGVAAAGLDGQLPLLFQNIRTLLSRAAATTDNVAQVTFFMRDLSERKKFNEPWVEMFPRSDDRPPYKYLPAPLPDNLEILLQMHVIPGATREEVLVPGMMHVDPIPMGVKIGGMLFSSRILAPICGLTGWRRDRRRRRAGSSGTCRRCWSGQARPWTG